MTDADCRAAIAAERAKWGDRLLILGHHYQDAAVVALCDAVGDSLELSRAAAASRAERIVFFPFYSICITVKYCLGTWSGNRDRKAVDFSSDSFLLGTSFDEKDTKCSHCRETNNFLHKFSSCILSSHCKD